jgi:purine-cytosine permease-like protein
VFGATFTGLTLSFVFTFVLGTGLASGLQNDTVWNAAGTGTGALVVAGYDGLGAFGKFCSVIAALGLIANMVPPTYSSGIDFQILGRYPAIVPRYLWNTLAVIIFAVCALAGRNSLSEIFTNFLALMGYCEFSPSTRHALPTNSLFRGCSLDCDHSRRGVHIPPKDEAHFRLE